MTKNEMLAKISEKTELSKTVIDNVIKVMSDEILEVIAANDSYKFGDVCTFKGIDKPARTCRNPRTGETIEIPPRSGAPKAVFSKKARE